MGVGSPEPKLKYLLAEIGNKWHEIPRNNWGFSATVKEANKVLISVVSGMVMILGALYQ